MAYIRHFNLTPDMVDRPPTFRIYCKCQCQESKLFQGQGHWQGQRSNLGVTIAHWYTPNDPVRESDRRPMGVTLQMWHTYVTFWQMWRTSVTSLVCFWCDWRVLHLTCDRRTSHFGILVWLTYVTFAKMWQTYITMLSVKHICSFPLLMTWNLYILNLK